ncbi:hypothetical protein [Sulfolobus sp. E11-6]|nr:hypothetical protein [Sulfolobus sp. E11-6]
MVRKRLLNGELTVDIYNFRKVISDLGIKYVNSLDEVLKKEEDK